MISKQKILSMLTPNANQEVILVDDQDVDDIMAGIDYNNGMFAHEYERIYPYFVGSDLISTCRNVFRFLKSNVPYYVESDDWQTVRSPAAILDMKNGDCKAYATFACGVMDAIRNNVPRYRGIGVAYRFSGYENTTDIEHVFCVVTSKDKKEIWIDPVLNFFDYRKSPYVYVDKKIKPMALVQISGIGCNGCGGNNVGELNFGSLLETGSEFIIPGGGLIFGGFEDLFDIFGGSAPSPDDWKGWDSVDKQYSSPLGTQAVHWTLEDGDSVENEAGNIWSYLNSGRGLQNMLETPTAKSMGKDPFLARLVNKLQRGGRTNEANEITKSMASGGTKATAPGTTPAPPAGSGIPPAPPAAGKDNTMMYVVGGALALLLITKK